MASWNHQYGTLYSPESSKSPSPRKRMASSSLEPVYASQSSLTSSATPSESDAYSNSNTEGRQPSSNPLNPNDAINYAVEPPYNPSLLLNPRGGFQQQPQPQRFENSFPSNPQAQAIAFHFDSPAGSYQQPPPARPSHQQNANQSHGFSAYANGGGMGHMLERMHNVADRSMVPQKRQKLHDERPDDARKAEFHGGGKGGVLGEYVRLKKEEGQKENAALTTAVDLSAGLCSLGLSRSSELTVLFSRRRRGHPSGRLRGQRGLLWSD